MNVNTDAHGTASHLPVLRWAIEVAGHRVLEFGGGLFSTAVLHEFDPWTVTIERDAEWHAKLVEDFPGHRITDNEAVVAEGWDVALIDHGTGEWEWIDQRAAALTSCQGHVGIALVHDWHIGPGHRDDVVARFRFHAWFAPDDGSMHTAMASDIYDVADARIEGGAVYTTYANAPAEFPN